MTRLTRFESHSTHPMLGKDLRKLTVTEIEFCRRFIMDRESQTDDQFAHDVNRIGLSDEAKIFKNKVLVWSLLIQSIDVKLRRRS